MTSPVTTILTIVVAFYIPVIVMIILYSRVYRETRQRQEELKNLQAFRRRSSKKCPPNARQGRKNSPSLGTYSQVESKHSQVESKLSNTSGSSRSRLLTFQTVGTSDFSPADYPQTDQSISGSGAGRKWSAGILQLLRSTLNKNPQINEVEDSSEVGSSDDGGNGVLLPDSGVLLPESGVLLPDSGVLFPDSGVLLPESTANGQFDLKTMKSPFSHLDSIQKAPLIHKNNNSAANSDFRAKSKFAGSGPAMKESHSAYTVFVQFAESEADTEKKSNMGPENVARPRCNPDPVKPFRTQLSETKLQVKNITPRRYSNPIEERKPEVEKEEKKAVPSILNHHGSTASETLGAAAATLSLLRRYHLPMPFELRRSIKTSKKNKLAQREKRQESKAAKTLSAILLAFVITWTPYSVIIVIETLRPNTVSASLFAFSYFLCYITVEIQNKLLFESKHRNM